MNTTRTLLLTTLLAACGSELPATIEVVDGREVEIATGGSGGSTVVFEAGLGRDWTTWDAVASDVAKHARVFAYSRQGYGASGPLTTSRTPSLIVEELRSLLSSQGYAPPYLLVGHSNGGGYVELFAKTHPAEVTGVIMVDPRHRDFLTACEAANLDICGLTEDELADQSSTVDAEYRAYATLPDEMRAVGPFGNYPVRVLTAESVVGSGTRVKLWRSLHAQLAAEAADGLQITVTGAGHGIPDERPEAIVNTILSILPEEK